MHLVFKLGLQLLWWKQTISAICSKENQAECNFVHWIDCLYPVHPLGESWWLRFIPGICKGTVHLYQSTCLCFLRLIAQDDTWFNPQIRRRANVNPVLVPSPFLAMTRNPTHYWWVYMVNKGASSQGVVRPLDFSLPAGKCCSCLLKWSLITR